MGLFGLGKKKNTEEKSSEEAEAEAALSADNAGDPNADPEVPVAEDVVEEKPASSDVQVVKLSADVEKLKAQFSTFFEMQKASNERFKNLSESIGGLRTQMMERDKEGQRLEAKATQAIDLVKTVQPDKFLVDLRKMDSKIEALKANLEGNETVIKNTIGEIKEMRNRLVAFKGMEQVMKLNEDSKAELIEIKKMAAVVERHGDKVETIFSEMQKKFKEFIRTTDTVKDLDKSFKDLGADLDAVKVKITAFGSKKEIENLIAKFDDFEKYVGNIVTLINKRFDKLNKDFGADFTKKFEETDKLISGFRLLAEKTPDLNKYFDLLTEEQKKKIEEEKAKGEGEGEEVEKIKEMGEDERPKVEEKESIATKVAGAVGDAASKAKDAVGGKK